MTFVKDGIQGRLDAFPSEVGKDERLAGMNV